MTTQGQEVSPERWATFVTHNPDRGFPQRVERVAAQAAQIVCIDNASEQASAATLEEVARMPCVRLVRNACNMGLATALNQAAHAAVEAGIDWLLLLDQDSTLEPNLVDHLWTVATTQRGPVGLVGANWVDATGQVAVRDALKGDSPAIEVTTAITSGSLLSLRAYQAVGPFREDLFIDGVDHEFCLRLRAKGYRVLVTRQPLMKHQLGRQARYRLGPLSFAMSNHPPRRRYYMTRNRLTIAWSYLRREPLWVARDLATACIEACLIPCLERQGGRKLAAMALGIWHAAIRRRGPLPDHRFGD